LCLKAAYRKTIFVIAATHPSNPWKLKVATLIGASSGHARISAADHSEIVDFTAREVQTEAKAFCACGLADSLFPRPRSGITVRGLKPGQYLLASGTLSFDHGVRALEVFGIDWAEGFAARAL
jgi:hypothetical protein